MSRYDDDDITYILMAPCGDAIEVWEPVAQLTAWCDVCMEYHAYIPE